MSFNLSINAAGASMSNASFTEDAGCGTPVPGPHPHPHGLQALTHASASYDEEGPRCGTKVPGHPPLPHSLQSILSSVLDKVALNPQPLPPKEAAVSALAGQVMDDEQCGSVPHKGFHWPPPPPPWMNGVSETALHADVSGLVNGAANRQM